MRTKYLLKFTQPVLMQSYNDKFELPKKSYRMPAPAGSVLVAGKKEEALSPVMKKKFCFGTGKAMHAMQYSKPEMCNAVQDLFCHMHKAVQDHFEAMLHVLRYSLETVEQLFVHKPNRKRDGSQSHEFVLSGRSDSDYAKEPKDRCSVSGHVVYLERGASNVQEWYRKDSVIVHYQSRDMCRCYLCSRHAVYEKHAGVTWT